MGFPSQSKHPLSGVVTSPATLKPFKIELFEIQPVGDGLDGGPKHCPFGEQLES